MIRRIDDDTYGSGANRNLGSEFRGIQSKIVGDSAHIGINRINLPAAPLNINGDIKGSRFDFNVICWIYGGRSSDGPSGCKHCQQ
ncbi:hypothetical protein D3C85_1572820 [compost metagenome]